MVVLGGIVPYQTGSKSQRTTCEEVRLAGLPVYLQITEFLLVNFPLGTQQISNC